MQAAEVRRRVVRNGAVWLLVVVTAVTASFVATLSGPLWRQSRPGCVVHELPGEPGTFPGGLVVCTGSGVDEGLRWPGVAVGVVLALAVVLASGWLRRVAQALVLLVVAAGSAVFVADQRRWAGVHTMICYPGAEGCAYPAWAAWDLLVGGLVGLAIGVMVLGLVGVTRPAARVREVAAR